MNHELPLEPGSPRDQIDRLYRAAWALCGSREEAEGLVEETFARGLRRPRFLRAERGLGDLLRLLRQGTRPKSGRLAGAAGQGRGTELESNPGILMVSQSPR